MMNPLLSVIVTTRNEEENIGNCLESVKGQTYKNLEVIVVDNKSTDKTKEIAKKYTKNVFDKGPERSAQRNYGAKKAKGKYLLFLDADMIMTPNVVADCVNVVKENVGGVIIPEESFGEGFWAKTKALERSFYVGNDLIEAARFYPKEIFEEVGGFDENLTGPEDWDLSQRVSSKYKIERIKSFIRHNEGRLSLYKTLKKKYYYAKKFSRYASKEINKKNYSKQINILARYKLFFADPKKLLKNTSLSLGMLFMKTMEYTAGALGYSIMIFKKNEKSS